MNAIPARQSALLRLKVLGLALGFVVVSVACRLILWGALSFLDEKSIVRNTVTGVVMLGLVVALTVWVQRRRPAMQRSDLVLLPRANFSSVRLTLGGLVAGSVLFGIVYAVVLATGGIRVEWRPVGLLSLGGILLAALLATILNAA